MKTFRKVLLIAAGAALLGGATLALRAQDRKAMRSEGPMIEKFGGQLGLTDAQKSQLAALKEKQRPVIQAIRDDAKLTSEQKHEKIRAAQQAARQEAAAILTPEQKAKLQAGKHRLRERAKHAAKAQMHSDLAGWHSRQLGRGPHGPGMGQPQGPMMGMRGQRPPMGAGFAPQFGGPPHAAGFRGGMGPKPGAGLNLSAEQQAKIEAVQQRQREKAEAIMKAGRDEVRALLTPEQQKLFDAHQARGPGGN